NRQVGAVIGSNVLVGAVPGPAKGIAAIIELGLGLDGGRGKDDIFDAVHMQGGVDDQTVLQPGPGASRMTGAATERTACAVHAVGIDGCCADNAAVTDIAADGGSQGRVAVSHVAAGGEAEEAVPQITHIGIHDMQTYHVAGLSIRRRPVVADARGRVVVGLAGILGRVVVAHAAAVDGHRGGIPVGRVFEVAGKQRDGPAVGMAVGVFADDVGTGGAGDAAVRHADAVGSRQGVEGGDVVGADLVLVDGHLDLAVPMLGQVGRMAVGAADPVSGSGIADSGEAVEGDRTAG